MKRALLFLYVAAAGCFGADDKPVIKSLKLLSDAGALNRGVWELELTFGNLPAFPSNLSSHMPKTRQPREILARTRLNVWLRDHRRCVRCASRVGLKQCHVDHVQSGIYGSNHVRNLRTLCRRCHVLLADHRHHGMIAAALRDGIIPPDWRDHVWED